MYLENGCLHKFIMDTELTFDSNCHLDLEILGHQNAKVRKFTCRQVLQLYGSITFTFGVSCEKENITTTGILTRANLYAPINWWGRKMFNVPRFIIGGGIKCSNCAKVYIRYIALQLWSILWGIGQIYKLWENILHILHVRQANMLPCRQRYDLPNTLI